MQHSSPLYGRRTGQLLLQEALGRGARRFNASNVVSDGEQQVIVRIERGASYD